MTIAERMKEYERLATTKAMPLLPLCARIDGRAFHTWTRGLNTPFDENFTRIMDQVTTFLVEETGAVVGYTQSDEITLLFYSDNSHSQIFFDGKIQKMTSMLASMATAKFNELWTGFGRPLAFFDCRVWQVPTLEEAVNVLVWREHDCIRNSVFAAARSKFSHSELLGKNTTELQAVIDWEGYPTRYKRGRYVARRSIQRQLTAEELARIPAQHRPSPDAQVHRTQVVPLDIPPICGIMNRVGVFFFGDDPKTS